MKKKGSGLFKPVTQSAALAKVTGISGKASRIAITKAVWAYIKKKVRFPGGKRRKGQHKSKAMSVRRFPLRVFV